jgi:hypothetical protein
MATPFVGVAAASTGPDPAVALGAIDSCLEKLNADIDVGYERIAGRCPQLARRLEEGGWSAWLPRDWKRTGNDLSAGGLRELREMLMREPAITQERFPRPRVSQLPAVLASLTPATSAQAGWWARTKEWLRDVFERSEQESDAGWLARLVGQNGLPQIVLELISYAALLLVVLLAVVIVANELRVSGVGARFRSTFRRRSGPMLDVRSEREEPALDTVGAFPLAQRPQLLLEIVIARLTAASCLPPARALTIRELTRAARLAHEDDRERLSQLARTCERVRFSGLQVSSEDLGAAVEHGRMLVEHLVGRP